MNHSKGIVSLTPLPVFLAVYLLSSLLASDFYKVPVSAAFLVACIYAVIISKGSMEERIASFSKGASNPNILLMIWIFILAGSFAGTAKAIGSVEATVNLTISVIPPKMIFAGLFLTACFISMSIGTSVGTIVALVPIGSGIAQSTGTSEAYMAALIMGGAFFGDNLSFISDTTIAATRAAGCQMSDKFKTNVLIIAPAFVIVTLIYLFHGQAISPVASVTNHEWFKTIPYLLVIVMALMGVNVLLVLVAGLVSNFVIALVSGCNDWLGLLAAVGDGISGMSDLIIVTLLAGGLLELIRRSGGLDYIIELLSKHTSGSRSAQASIAAMVGIANLCTANNTIAIITTAGIAKGIAERFGIDPRKLASILDTFSCIVQSFIPYGAQMLMTSALASVPATQIMPYLYYPMIMAACAVLAIIFDFPRFKSDLRHLSD